MSVKPPVVWAEANRWRKDGSFMAGVRVSEICAELRQLASGISVTDEDGKSGGRSWIRTSEGVSQQIYSLPPLATWVSYHPAVRFLAESGLSQTERHGSRPILDHQSSSFINRPLFAIMIGRPSEVCISSSGSKPSRW